MEHRSLNLIDVTDLSDPRVADYGALRDKQLKELTDPTGRAAGGVFIAEGELVVRHLVASGFVVRSVLLTETRLRTVADALERLPSGTPVYVASQPVMNAVVGFNIHRGILACGVRGAGRSLDELTRTCRTLVVLEGLVNHDNVGGIFRCAAALGGAGTGVVLSPGCCDPLYRKAIRVSVGHVLRVPFCRCDRWPGAIDDLRAAGFRTVAMATGGECDVGAVGVGPEGRVALCMGSEGQGLSRAVVDMADLRVRIAMGEGVDSLNVVVATGIALHRLGRV